MPDLVSGDMLHLTSDGLLETKSPPRGRDLCGGRGLFAAVDIPDLLSEDILHLTSDGFLPTKVTYSGRDLCSGRSHPGTRTRTQEQGHGPRNKDTDPGARTQPRMRARTQE
jgi:hypothetical protein